MRGLYRAFLYDGAQIEIQNVPVESQSTSVTESVSATETVDATVIPPASPSLSLLGVG